MRFAARTDSNHSEVVKALRKIGASVQSMAAIGKGCPDLLVGFRGKAFVLEVKDGAKPPSARQLTADQTKWRAAWKGDYHVVESPLEAVAAITGGAI